MVDEWEVELKSIWSALDNKGKREVVRLAKRALALPGILSIVYLRLININYKIRIFFHRLIS